MFLSYITGLDIPEHMNLAWYFPCMGQLNEHLLFQVDLVAILELSANTKPFKAIGKTQNPQIQDASCFQTNICPICVRPKGQICLLVTCCLSVCHSCCCFRTCHFVQTNCEQIDEQINEKQMSKIN